MILVYSVESCFTHKQLFHKFVLALSYHTDLMSWSCLYEPVKIFKVYHSSSCYDKLFNFLHCLKCVLVRDNIALTNFLKYKYRKSY